MLKCFLNILLIVSLVCCKPENRKDCFKSYGKEVNVTRYLDNFEYIVLNDNIDYEVIQFPKPMAIITSGENLMSNIHTAVQSNSLIVENKNKCNFVRGYNKKTKIKIYTPFIRTLFHQGVGQVNVNSNFVQDTIFINGGNSGNVNLYGNYQVVQTSSHGNTNIHFYGTTNELLTYLKGTNYLYADNSTIKSYANITTISIADVYLKLPSTASLVVNIFRDGNIYYNGNPFSILNKTEGNPKGKLIKND